MKSIQNLSVTARVIIAAIILVVIVYVLCTNRNNTKSATQNLTPSVKTSTTAPVQAIIKGRGTAIRTIAGDTYTPGTAVTVKIILSPDAGVVVQSLTEIPPSGWVVGNVSDGGKFDKGGIRWGIFFDGNPRTVSYTITPPIKESGLYIFKGTAGFDASVVQVGGKDRLFDGK